MGTRKVVQSKKRIRANLDKEEAKRTYRKVFCALVLKRFKIDLCKILFKKILRGKNRARRLDEADWDITHELSSSSADPAAAVQVSVREKTFDAQLVSNLKTADTKSFVSTTVEDKGVLVETKTMKIYEDDGSVPVASTSTMKPAPITNDVKATTTFLLSGYRNNQLDIWVCLILLGYCMLFPGF